MNNIDKQIDYWASLVCEDTQGNIKHANGREILKALGEIKRTNPHAKDDLTLELGNGETETYYLWVDDTASRFFAIKDEKRISSYSLDKLLSRLLIHLENFIDTEIEVEVRGGTHNGEKVKLLSGTARDEYFLFDTTETHKFLDVEWEANKKWA